MRTSSIVLVLLLVATSLFPMTSTTAAPASRSKDEGSAAERSDPELNTSESHVHWYDWNFTNTSIYSKSGVDMAESWVNLSQV